MLGSASRRLPENDQYRPWGGRQFSVVEETSLRLEGLLFPSIADVVVLWVNVNHEAIRIEARSTAAEAGCPSYASQWSRIHSSCLRFPADVPSAGRRVVLCLWVRRFFCRNAACGRRTFVE